MKLTKLTKKLIVCLFAIVLVLGMSIVVSAADTDYTLDADTMSMSLTSLDSTDTITYDSSTYLFTMTVDGVETVYDSTASYSGDIVIQITPYLGEIAYTSAGNTDEDNDYLYRTALYIDSTGIIASNSVTSALLGGTYSATAMDGVTVTSYSDQFSAIILYNPVDTSTGTLEYTITNSNFYMLSSSDGSNNTTCDFTGEGGAIDAFGDVLVTISDSYIHTTGVAKVALFFDDGADLVLDNTDFDVDGGTLSDDYANNASMSGMVAPPWVLGISGNARGTNLLGTDSTSTFVDSDFTTTGWGVLSVDNGSDGVINVLNCSLTTTSNTGYGIYVIGDAVETFYGCTFDVGTYAAIMTGGDITFTSLSVGQTVTTTNGADTDIVTVSSDEISETTYTTVDSQFGVMAHQSGTISVLSGTVFDTANATFILKAGVQDIVVDDSTITSDDGIILQMIDNDDSVVGVDGTATLTPTFNTTFYEDAGYPTEAYSTTEAETASTATFTNVDLTGDIYNATGYTADARSLDVTLGEGATLTGVISSSTAIHVQMEENTTTGQYDYVTDENGNYVQATEFTIDEYYNLGHVVNEIYYNGYNNTSVTLTDGAEWTVTGESYIQYLFVSNSSTLNIDYMTVNGVVTTFEKGVEYTGDIVLYPIESTATNDSDTSIFGVSESFSYTILADTDIVSALATAGMEASDSAVLVAYDFTVADDVSDVLVKTPVPSSLTDYSTIYVYVVNEDGSLTECDAYVNNGYLYFTAPHFSTYIFSSEALVAATTTTDDTTTGGTTTDGTTTDTTGTTTGTTSGTTTTTTSVATGDSANMILFSTLTIVALAAVGGAYFYTVRKNTAEEM